MLEFFLVEVAAFLLFTGYLVYTYSSKSVAFYVLFFVYTSWLLSFSIVVILPLDIYYVNFYYSNDISKFSESKNLERVLLLKILKAIILPTRLFMMHGYWFIGQISYTVGKNYLFRLEKYKKIGYFFLYFKNMRMLESSRQKISSNAH